MKNQRLFKIQFWLVLCFTYIGVSAQNCKIIYDVNFNNHGNIEYSITKAKADFNKNVKPYTAATYRGLAGETSKELEQTPQETRIVNGTLRAEYLKDDASGRAGGFLFDPYFPGVESAYLEYKVKFASNFKFRAGGKLPGLGGSTVGTTSETVGKGTIPSGRRYNEDGNGFSARLMWRRNTELTVDPYLILYSYFAKEDDGIERKDHRNGDTYRFFSGLETNKWYKIKQYIKLNTPGKDNGIVKMWVDGVLLFQNYKMNIRKEKRDDLKINALIMHTYRGGNRTDPWWQSPQNDYAFFDDFKVWTGCSTFPNGTSSNTAPQVSLTKPVNGSIHQLGNTITLSANASDDDNNIDKVNFKVNGNFFKTDSDAPYTTTFKPVATGTYKISAKVFDTEGLAEEKSVSITVVDKAPTNQSPTVDIKSPLNNSTYELGSVIDLTATAVDPDGNLDKVNFKIDGNFFRTDSDAPYTSTFKPITTGTYRISAKAFDSAGLSDEKFVTITVEEPARGESKPTVKLISPTSQATYELGETILFEAEASDIDGVVEKVNFLIDDKFHALDNAAPYKNSFTPSEVGSYKIAARAFDEDGLTDEQYVTVNVVKPAPENQAPVVTITSPVDNAVYELGETINLTSSATDPDGNIEKINFKINEEFYHFSRINPSNTTFTPDLAATYKIAARVFDSNGLSDEKFVTITVVEPAPVNRPPVVDVVSPANEAVFELGETIQLAASAKDPDGNLRNINFKIDDQFYKWVSSGNAKASFTPTEAGSYKIAARAVDDEGLFDEKYVTVIVEDPTLSNQEFIDSTVNKNITLFPNPAKDKLLVKGITNTMSYNIFDITGKAIHVSEAKSTETAIDISNYPKGVYFIRITSDSISKSMTFIKK